MLGRAENKIWQQRVMAFYAAMATASLHLSESDQKELEEWDRASAPELGTSAWPKWKNYIPEAIYIDFPALIEEQKRFPRREKRRKKKAIPAEIRWAVWERDNFTCRRCSSRTRLSIDHIVAESKGGDMSLDNLQTLCMRCNSAKGAK